MKEGAAGHHPDVAEPWLPSMHLREIPGGCRLSLGGCAHGAGPTLQAALDDLVASVLDMATAVQSGEDARRLVLDGLDRPA